MTLTLTNVPEPTAPVMLLGANAAPDPTNYAEDKATVDRFMKDVPDTMTTVRNQMVSLQSQWQRLWMIWNGKHTFRLYLGRSDLRIPISRKIIDSIVAQVVADVFPEASAFVGFPNVMTPAAMLSADANEKLLAFDVRQAKLGQKLTEHVRDFLIYGTGIFKCDWKTRTLRKSYQRQPLAPPVTQEMDQKGLSQPGLRGVTFGPMQAAPGEDGPLLYAGPNITNVDIMRWFIHPFTVREIDQARLIFENIDTDLTYLKQMEQKKQFTNVSQISKPDSFAAIHPSDAQRELRLQPYGLSLANIPNRSRDNYRIDEGYIKWDLFQTGEEIDCKFTMCGHTLLELRQNPFFWQQPPYFASRYTKANKDLFFGAGLLEIEEDMQYMVDALANQAVDSAVLQSQPIVAMDSSRLDQDSQTYRMAPGATWKFNGNPEDILKIITFPDTSSTGFQTVNLLGGIMQDVAAMPPIAQGKLASRSTTATEAKLAEAGAATGLESIGQSINEDTMTPLINWMYMLEGQNRRVDTYVSIVGHPPIPLTAADLCLNMSLYWLTGTMIDKFIESQEKMRVAKAEEAQGTDAMQAGGQMGGMMGAPAGGMGGPMGAMSQGPMATMPGAPQSQGFNGNGIS